MKRLLIDIGNTRVKWCLSEDDTLGPLAALPHAPPEFDAALVAALAALPRPQQVWIASVAAPEVAERMRAALSRRWPGLEPREVRATAVAGGVRSAYAEPARLGVDRLLAMVGAHRRAAGAALVAGAGTALALDLVDADGRHRGGLIAPSPALMQGAVLAGTARVAPHAAGQIAGFGRSTDDALASGCWLAAAALIERAFAMARSELGAAPALLLHGGDADAMASLLTTPAQLAPALVLEGLLGVASEPAD